MRKSSLAKMAIVSAILIVSNSCATGIHRCYEGEPRPKSEIAKIHFRGFVSYTVDGEACRLIKEVRKYNSPKWYIELLPGTYVIIGLIDTSKWRSLQPSGDFAKYPVNVPCMKSVTVEAGQIYRFKGFLRVTDSYTYGRGRAWEFTQSFGYPDCEIKH